MTQTNQMVEFEATQEYLGQAKHVCHLAPQWKTYLETDLAIHGGVNTTLADVVSGQPLAQEGRGRQHGAAAAAAAHQFAGTAAVSNLGDDPNWTGHEFSAAITYAYGRLSWDPTLTAAEVTREWVDSTWSPVDEAASNAMVSLLMSRCGHWHFPLPTNYLEQP
jgi:alpha-glucuronidase